MSDQELPPEIEAIRLRCDKASFPYRSIGDSDETDYLQIEMPCGRERRTVTLSPDMAPAFLRTDFESWVFLGDYIAAANYKAGTIEAALHRIDTTSGPKQAWDQLPYGRTDLILKSTSLRRNTELIVSNQFEILNTIGGLDVVENPSFSAIRITGDELTGHDEARSLLEELTNSLFFQIDVLHDIPLGLARFQTFPRRLAISEGLPAIPLHFPTQSYDRAPMELYWYARSASEMPLLQFLAYYQVLEFYFPAYSETAARTRIRNVLKDPAFRVERDAHIARILIASKSMGNGYGDERSQLKATLQQCIDPEELRTYLIDDERRREAVTKKLKGLSDVRVNLNSASSDIRAEIAERIYDIRCRIVHTKAQVNTGPELLLPFSKEAKSLRPEIELMHFLATKMLIASSTSRISHSPGDMDFPYDYFDDIPF